MRSAEPVPEGGGTQGLACTPAGGIKRLSSELNFKDCLGTTVKGNVLVEEEVLQNATMWKTTYKINFTNKKLYNFITLMQC